ncbi:FAD-dependent oxidoreductase [Flavivirga aquimarina]|uniref:FAD-dependent oxidoreductase n=1 Tax=Flavivirga aquimarina TaxID=2027862 RepID=A0ABT8WC07_9FLAO|nr:FAD-dependent oxidoreductase [Flavivirga aquimarina]MDO5970684.1 FAD-dependent oxidoreductase [Flavivirga aquimarina]
MKKVVIIGGGISGLCSAYYLLKQGYAVTVLDKSDISTGASFINAGYVIPSHFIPLAAPGIMTQGLKWLLNSSSPFYIKPRLDFDFFKWAIRFKKSATESNVERSIPILKALNLKSQYLYENMLASLDFHFHYEKKGLLMAFSSTKIQEEEYKIAKRAVEEGLDLAYLSKSELINMEPVFSDHAIGAIHYKCDSHTTPNHFMNQMKTWLKSKGVVFEINQKVEKFTANKKQISSVITQNSVFEADEFVLAAGSWTSSLASSLNLNIPIQGGKGYSLDVYRPTSISIPTLLLEAKVAVTPMENFTRFAGTMEFSGNNTIIRKKRVEAIARAAKNYYKDVEINQEEKNNAKSGLRPVSPDGLPYIGRTSKYNNLTIASGHAMMGWSLGPITGKLVTETINNQKTSVDLTPFSPERFK